MLPPAELATHHPAAYNKAAYRLVLAGVLLVVFGLAVTLGTIMLTPGGYSAVSYGPMILGAGLIAFGLRR